LQWEHRCASDSQGARMDGPRSKVELFAAIRRVSRTEKLSIHELARRHGVHRRLVREALTSPWPTPRKPGPPQAPDHTRPSSTVAEPAGRRSGSRWSARRRSRGRTTLTRDDEQQHSWQRGRRGPAVTCQATIRTSRPQPRASSRTTNMSRSPKSKSTSISTGETTAKLSRNRRSSNDGPSTAS